MFANSNHFKIHPKAARALFADSVNRVEIEISSFCNRVCSYCPNSFIDRRALREKMSDELFSSIIGQLAEIDWNGILTFHRYNEPMSDRDYLISRMREARTKLPRAALTIFTNGDYLNEDYLRELYAAGCRNICATIHIEPAEYSDEKAMALLEKRLRELKCRYKINSSKKGLFAKVFVADDMDFTYQVLDFSRSIDGDPVRKDRGQSLAPNVEM